MELLSLYSEFRLTSPMMFLAGVLVGLILGWVFEGVISILFRAAFVGLLVTIAYLAFRFWRNTRSSNTELDDIPDASWRDLDPRRRK